MTLEKFKELHPAYIIYKNDDGDYSVVVKKEHAKKINHCSFSAPTIKSAHEKIILFPASMLSVPNYKSILNRPRPFFN